MYILILDICIYYNDEPIEMVHWDKGYQELAH